MRRQNYPWETKAIERNTGMKTEEIEIGLRVYNRGDMANQEHWGTITKILKNDRFGNEVEITPDPEAEHKPYTIWPHAISKVDKGHGGTRIITEKAYHEYREKQIALMQERLTA